MNAHYNLGLTSLRRLNLPQAQASFEAAHQLDPAHKPTLLNLGKVYRLQGKFDQAIALYEKAVGAPDREYDVPLLNNLTVAYRLKKNYVKAEATARKVLSRSKDNPDAYKNLALLYYDQGNYKLAEFISANARKLDAKDPGVYNNLGMIYLKLEERARALGQFQKAVELNGSFAPGHMNLGAMALAYRDYETAEKAFSKAVQLDPTSAEGHLYYAFSLDGQKGRDPKKGLAAASEFEKVLAIRPQTPEAICGAGWAFATDKAGWDRAIGYFEKCKVQAITTPTDVQLIDAKMKGILAMQKSGAAQPAPVEVKKEAPKAPTGPSVLDKLQQEEGATEGSAPPAEGGQPPAEGQTPPPSPGTNAAPAPTPAPAG